MFATNIRDITDDFYDENRSSTAVHCVEKVCVDLNGAFDENQSRILERKRTAGARTPTVVQTPQSNS
jgi:hypothetical protein